MSRYSNVNIAIATNIVSGIPRTATAQCSGYYINHISHAVETAHLNLTRTRIVGPNPHTYLSRQKRFSVRAVNGIFCIKVQSTAAMLGMLIPCSCPRPVLLAGWVLLAGSDPQETSSKSLRWKKKNHLWYIYRKYNKRQNAND